MRWENKILIFLVIAVLSGGLSNLSLKLGKIQNEAVRKENENAYSVAILKGDIAYLQKQLDGMRIERDGWESKYNAEIGKITLLTAQVESIKGTVGILEKIKQTDTELLKKYSKIYFLNENYRPVSLVDIPEEFQFNPQKKLKIHSGIADHLMQMLGASRAEGADISIISAYRSFYEQAGVKSAYSVTYGSGTANQFSADQGYSEHQLGTTVDFTTSKNGENFSGFDKTAGFEWLKNNAYKYGFILSYPKGNSYYIYEPWHWRFVGKQLASDLHAQGKTFYDMDQREIDKYLQFFFDK